MIKYILSSLLALGLGFLYASQIPRLKVFLLREIQATSRHEGVEVKARGITFSVLPIGIQLHNVTIQPRGKAAAVLSPGAIDQLSIYLNTLALVAGRLEIGQIKVHHPTLSVFIKHSKEDSDTPKLSNKSETIPWDRIMQFPIRSFDILQADIRASVEDQHFVIQARDLGVHFEKGYQAAKFEIYGPDVLLKHPGPGEHPIPLAIGAKTIIEKNAFEVAAMKLSVGNSFVIGRGVARGEVTDLKWSVVNGRVLSHLELPELTNLIRNYFPGIKIPASAGTLNFEFLARQQRGKEPIMSGEAEGEALKIDKFSIGNFKTKFKYGGGEIASPQVAFSSSAGTFQFQDVSIKMANQEMRIAGRALIEKVELGHLLHNLDVKAPLHYDLTGRLPCEGTIKPSLVIQCGGEIDGENFSIYSTDENDKPDKRIAAFKTSKIVGLMVIDKDKIVFPKGVLKIGNSSGEAIGLVDYDKGFDFKFRSDDLNFKDIESLAELKYDGSVGISGETSGTGHTGMIKAAIRAKNFWFENYGFGNTGFDFRYQTGKLYFTGIQGAFDNASYSGQATIDLGSKEQKIEPTIAANVNLQKFDLADLLTIFSKKVKLPFQATGLGSATIDAQGPFALSSLTYTVNATVGHGKIAGETFQSLKFNVHGIRGHAFADQVVIKKGSGQFVLKGDVQSNGQMNVNVTGEGLRLADSDWIHMISDGLDGTVAGTMTLRDFILKPHVQLNGSITQASIKQHFLEDSDFFMSIDHGGVRLTSGLFAQKIKAAVTFPFEPDKPFSFKFDTTDFDFSDFLGVTSKNGIKKDYETSLTAHVDLSSKQGGFWKSTGDLNVPKLYVRHGTVQMKNARPILVKFNDGLVTVESFKVQGDNTDITVQGSRSRQENLNFNINGRIDLSLLAFLMPFMRDMSGQLSLSTQIGGATGRPDLLGSAFITKGYFKVEALPHPFENVNADFLFSQSKVLVNRFKCGFGGGQLSAGGSLSFVDLNNIPVEITGDLAQANLNIPDGLSTHGNIHFLVTGNWFPYNFKGEYNIDGGLYSKNFGDSVEASLKRSSFLPQIISQKDFYPFDLDFNAHFQKGIAVKNNLIEGEARGDLNIRGDPEHPLLKGEVLAVTGGKILFRETPFLISAAKLKFDNPAENNPVVYALGTTRVRDWDISLLIQGTMKNSRISLTSSPPLPETSIVSLLALGIDDKVDMANSNAAGRPTDINARSQDQTALEVSAGSAILSQNPLQQELKKSLGVNVRLSQTVDDTRNVIMPRVVAEKQWTPQLSTSISRTVGDRVTKNVNVEYRLNKHFSILGSYEGRDFDALSVPGTTTQSNISQDIFGLDLQYQVEYK